MSEKRNLLIFSGIIGFFFCVSGIGKCLDTAAFIQLLNQYGILYANILSPIIIVSEICLGLCLLFGIFPKYFAGIAAVLLGVFTSVFTFAYIRYGITDCGCFGAINIGEPPLYIIYIRNGLLILVSAIIWYRFPKEISSIKKWKFIVISIVIAVTLFITGYTYKTGVKTNNTSPQNVYLYKHIRNTELSKYIRTSTDSTYMIFCFSYTCPHCSNSIQNFRDYKLHGMVDSVIAITSPNKKQQEIFNDFFKPDFTIIQLSKDKLSSIVQYFPTTFFIRNDTIVKVVQGELSSPYSEYKRIQKNNLKIKM